MPEPPSHSPIQSQVSLSELIDRGGFEASLITTFNANLPFYEEFVLRRLQAKNCRRNFVLMDAAQCASAWHSEASRPRYAGFEYTPIRYIGTCRSRSNGSGSVQNELCAGKGSGMIEKGIPRAK